MQQSKYKIHTVQIKSLYIHPMFNWSIKYINFNERFVVVGLFKAGSGPEPILIDRSPPIAGKVLDGNVIHHDIMYQSNDKEMCAQWTGFYDPESGIDQ